MINITRETFDNEITESPMPVLVDFYADWCAPCKMLAPILGELALDYEGRFKICKVNVDEERELAERFAVSSIPTLIFFKNGEKAGSMMGLQSRAALEEKISTLL